MSDDPLYDRLHQPKLDRMRAEHERTMRLIARPPEPSEANKRAIAEMASPEGWQRAIKEVIGNVGSKRRRAKLWLLVIALIGAAVVRETVELFGPTRCLFGSNFPVEKLWTRYSDLVAAYRDALKPFGDTVSRAALHDTAARIYRLN